MFAVMITYKSNDMECVEQISSELAYTILETSKHLAKDIYINLMLEDGGEITITHWQA